MATTLLVQEAPSFPLENKDLIPDQLRTRLTNRIAKKKNVDLKFAERMVNQMLAFLLLCADEPDVTHSPSDLVDYAWEEFVLYAREYEDFCVKKLGRIIYHSPADVPGAVYGSGGAAKTAARLKQRSSNFDQEMWPNADAQCSSDKCDNGDGDGH